MAASNIDSNRRRAVLAIDSFSYAYPGAASYTLRDVSMRIGPGECHLLQGPTGSGKTTLLMAIRGLLPLGQQSGTIDLNSVPEDTFLGSPGLIQQNPKAQLLCTYLGADIAFGLENHCVDPGKMVLQVEEALKAVGLNRPLHFPVDSLSMGQQYRACIAGQLVMHPQLVMMDEPVAQLDPAGRAKMLELIIRLKSSGKAVLISEHRADILQSVVDHSWCLECDGRLSRTGKSVHVLNGHSRQEGIRLNLNPTTDNIKERSAVIRVKRPQFAHRLAGLDLKALDFSVLRGECIALCGPNGSGKTTLVRAIAGLLQPSAGTVDVLGGPASLSYLRGSLTVLFQEPGKQLFESTVFDEVAFSARRRAATEEPHEVLAKRVDSLLAELDLSHLSELSPHLLSYGQKHLVGLAAVLAGKPEILLLDDPFSGLDRERAARVMQLVAKESAENGTTVLWTSHDAATLAGWADRSIELAADTEEENNDSVQLIPSEMDSSSLELSRQFQLPTGVMLSLCMALSMFAFAAHTTELLIGLSGINLLLLLLYSREPLGVLKKSGLLFFWQAALVVLLYTFRFGLSEGALSGGRVAWQLFLAFWPGMIFMSAESQPRIVRTLSKVLPQRTAFVSASCLRFLPMLLTEMQQIREVQILRGARIMVKDLKYPRYWPDWLFCLMIPTLIKTLSLAGDIATAATARDFGIYTKRTAWSGD